MKTHHTIEHRLHTLERSASRWRLVAVGSLTLFAGVLIGGMGTNSSQPRAQSGKKAVIGVAGTSDRLFRLHQDGSITYLRITKGERSTDGYFDWGDVKIDHTRKSHDLPQ